MGRVSSVDSFAVYCGRGDYLQTFAVRGAQCVGGSPGVGVVSVDRRPSAFERGAAVEGCKAARSAGLSAWVVPFSRSGVVA